MKKAISIKQPWAYLICAGIKDVENRTWDLPEKYKCERVFIHASGKPDEEPYMLFSDEQSAAIDSAIMDVCGTYSQNSQIIGYVRFIDCVINHPSIWAEKSEIGQDEQANDWIKPIYNWVIADPVLLDKPILNVKGKLRFWDCSEYL